MTSVLVGTGTYEVVALGGICVAVRRRGFHARHPRSYLLLSLALLQTTLPLHHVSLAHWTVRVDLARSA